MARIKGGLNAKKRHNRVLKLAKGYRGARSKQYRVAKQSVMRALTSSYAGRKEKKRQFRQLWIARINAAARMNGLSYSKFMYGLKLAEVNVNRKMLSEIAINEPKTFAELVKVAKDALEGKMPKEAKAEVKTTKKEVKEEKKETVESEMNAEVKKTAQTFRSVYMKEKSELNTLKVKRKIINCLEEKGYAAVDCDNQIDMVNREKVEDFCKAAEKEEQAAVDIVVVFDEGEIIQYHLESMNGKINVRLCQVKWKDNSPQANYYDEYEAYEWKYTEKGYLFLEEYHPPGFDGAPGETGFRVQPLDKTCRELNRKYVMPLGYALNNLLITNWDNQNYTELDFYDLYEKMYYMKYGKQVPYEANYGGAEYEVPKDEFEEVIKTYLPFSNSEIEKGTFYNSDNKTFRYRPRGLYDCEFPYEPYPEVISYEKLQDGTLKLTIEAVWEIRMLDQAITSELMIKPMEDGSFQYLSNKVISSDQNANAGWYMPRLTEEEWEENYSNN